MGLPLIVGLVTAAILLPVGLLSVAYIRFCRRRSGTDDPERGTQNAKVADSPDLPESAAVRRFYWSEIESLTGNFAPSAVVGEGGFSTVYLARLPGAGASPSLAAVKVHRSSERLHRAFRQELDVILRLRHPHIVRLVGYCDDREDGALAFEYVPNGSLHDGLHGGGPALPWARRTLIALRLAGALNYLHEGCDPQVVHGDIKASNVLLDARMEPKLCDFGSARMGFSAAVRPASGGGPTMMGSPGYVDPHYLRTGMVSKKSDVYSFGVLLLELITGAQAFCSEAERPLTAALAALLRVGRFGEVVVDPRLGVEYACRASGCCCWSSSPEQKINSKFFKFNPSLSLTSSPTNLSLSYLQPHALLNIIISSSPLGLGLHRELTVLFPRLNIIISSSSLLKLASSSPPSATMMGTNLMEAVVKRSRSRSPPATTRGTPPPPDLQVEAHVDALEVEAMAALGEQPDLLPVGQLREADGALEPFLEVRIESAAREGSSGGEHVAGPRTAEDDHHKEEDNRSHHYLAAYRDSLHRTAAAHRLIFRFRWKRVFGAGDEKAAASRSFKVQNPKSVALL